MNVPVNKALYARVKAEAKRKFKVYPSAYANAWLVREYKKRGGTYRVEKKRGKKYWRSNQLVQRKLGRCQKWQTFLSFKRLKTRLSCLSTK